MASQYLPHQIDEANLPYHYSQHQDNHGRVYYKLKSGDQRFPATFWASQRAAPSTYTASPPQQSYQPSTHTASSQQTTSPTDPIRAYRNKYGSVFRVVAHTGGPVAPGAQLSQNHWSIYFLLLNDEGSVRFNMSTNIATNTRNGIHETRPHPYTKSNSAVRYFDVPIQPGVSVDHVDSHIRSNGLDKYEMTEGGVGCRWWIQFIMRAFADQKYVDTKDVEASS